MPSPKLDLIKAIVEKDADIPMLHEIHMQLKFPMEQVQFLTVENPIINFETYALLLQIFRACDIIGYVEKAVDEVFPMVSKEMHDILIQFIHMTFYGHCRHIISKETFYETEEKMNEDIIGYTKQLFKCLEDECSKIIEIDTTVEMQTEEENQQTQQTNLNEQD